MARMTGVGPVAFAGRRMSAWSLTPSVDGIVASDHVAPGGTSAAEAVAGNASRARAMASRSLMAPATHAGAESCCHRLVTTTARRPWVGPARDLHDLASRPDRRLPARRRPAP